MWGRYHSLSDASNGSRAWLSENPDSIAMNIEAIIKKSYVKENLFIGSKIATLETMQQTPKVNFVANKDHLPDLIRERRG